jgi:hypothetical protein
MTARQVVSLLWQIFLHSRQFFSAAHDAFGNPPRSLLPVVVDELRQGVVFEHINVPYLQLLGSSQAPRPTKYL